MLQTSKLLVKVLTIRLSLLNITKDYFTINNINVGRGDDLKVISKVIKPAKVRTLEHVMIETRILSNCIHIRILWKEHSFNIPRKKCTLNYNTKSWIHVMCTLTCWSSLIEICWERSDVYLQFYDVKNMKIWRPIKVHGNLKY